MMRQALRFTVVATFATSALGTVALVQPSAGDGKPASAPAQPRPVVVKRVGDAYPFADCPICGKPLDAAGKPVVRVLDGREVRFCTEADAETFEKDAAANWAKIDERLIKDQAPLYPLDTSVVSGKPLGAAPVQVVVGNRLVRLADAAEKETLLKEPARYLADLDKAVIARQGRDYPAKVCIVSDEDLGSMGEARDAVVAGRLIRLCCKGCLRDLDRNPAKFIARIDELRRGAPGGGKAPPARP